MRERERGSHMGSLGAGGETRSGETSYEGGRRRRKGKIENETRNNA